MSSRPNSPNRGDWEDIKRGARVNFIGILARSLRAASLVLVARLFGSEALGFFLLGWSVVDVVSKLGLFGLDRSLIRFTPSTKGGPDGEERASVLSSAILLGGVTSGLTTAVLCLFAPVVASRLLGQPEMTTPLRVLAFAIPALTLSSILLALTRTERRMEYEVWVRSLIEPGLLLAGAVFFFLLKFGGRSLFWAQTLALAGGLVAALVVAWRLRLIEPGPAKAISKLTHFSLPIALYDFVAMAVMSLDYFVLARYVTPRELGIYGAAVQVAILIKKARQSFEPILVPVLSEQLARGDEGAVRTSMAAVERAIAAVAFGFVLAAVLFGRDVLGVFGPEFQAGAAALVVLALAHAVNGFWGVSENVILLRKPYWNLATWLVAAGVAVPTNVLLSRRYGMMGAAASVALVFLGVGLARLFQTHRLVRWNPFSWELFRLALAALVIGVVARSFIGVMSGGVLGRAALTAVSLFLYFAVAYRWRPQRLGWKAGEVLD